MSIHKASAADIKPPADGAKKPRGKKPPKRITQDYLHNAGLYYLQRFAASAGHFRAVMMRKVKRSCRHHADQDYNSCAAMVDALIHKFENAGLLNDAAYTNAIVSSGRRRGLSRRAIIARLQARGIDSEHTIKSLSSCDEENYGGGTEAERTAALLYARRRKLGPFASKQIETEKALAALGRRGFSYDTAQYIINLEKQEAEDLLNKLRS